MLSKQNPLILCLFLFLGVSSAWADSEHPQGTEFPQRIVSLGPINTENVYLLGADDRLVANTNYCVRPEAAKEIEKIGSVMQVSIEKIISLQPDLVLATGLTQMEQIRQLQSVGIKVVQFSQPASFAEICSQFLQLGRLLGLEDEAQQIVARARNKVSEVQKQVAPLPGQKVFLQVGATPLFASVPSSFTHDFIILAGGVNIAERQKAGLTSYERVIADNPDVILIAIMGTESGIASTEKEKWLQIPVIRAVQEQRIHLINPDLVCSPSPATFAEALTVIATLIHPGLTMEETP
ncbi:MAG: ABC transporter substrate-binding protein [Thermodesulfobacteriota bacterium]